jgi:L-lysine 2,3-aminomutase
MEDEKTALLWAMIDGIEPVHLETAKGLALELAERIDDRERAAELCAGLEDQLDRLWVAANFNWPLETFQSDARAALNKLVAAGFN